MLDIVQLLRSMHVAPEMYTLEQLGDKLYMCNFSDSTDIMRWHQRLRHLSTGAVRELTRNEETGIRFNQDGSDLLACTACMQGKLHHLPFKVG